MDLSLALELAAERYPEAAAIISPALRLNYREWNRRVHAVAWQLSLLGVKPGDYVAICTSGGEAPLTMYFAVMRLGAVAVMLNARWKHRDIGCALRETQAKIILFDEETKEEVWLAAVAAERQPYLVQACASEGAKEKVFNYFEWAEAYSRPFPGCASPVSEAGTILYTSGTTGRPKGVCRSAASDFAGALGIILEHGWERFERILMVMPVYHTMGLHTLISMVLLNGAMVIPEKGGAGEYLHFIEKEKVTALYLIPTVYHDLVRQGKPGKANTVRKLAYAGAPMSASLAAQCTGLFSPEIFANHYGCTEMLCITVNRNVPENPLSAGRPGLFSSLRVVPAARGRRVLPHELLLPGEVGEIIVSTSSPQAFDGYFRQPELTRAVVRKGWYFTGDLGYVDESGDLYLLGRVDDMIISGGENIYPAEVEAVLTEHPEVREAAVVGEPDARWGERVAAFIVPESAGLTGKELERFCLQSPRLARFKRPRMYIFVEEIPKTAGGKILRSVLRAALLDNKI
jgi:2-furoate---CoA ligase